MAKTFDQWMADNQFQTGYGPNYIYNNQGGGAADRSTAILNWQREQGTDYLSQLLGGGSGSASSSSGGAANPFGVPTMETGNRFEAGLSDAEARLKSLLDDPDSIKQTGAYKFRVKQGEDALQRQLGARGMLNSGNRLMELTKYGQDMGSQEYENQFGRLGNLLTNYSGSWIGDKNANTSRYSAEAGAWNAANNSQNQLKAIALRDLLGGGGDGGSMGGTRSISQKRSPYTGMTSYGMEFGGGVTDMGYYIDQLAEQDRQKRLADLLAMQQDNNELGVQFDTPQQPIPQQGSLSDLMNSGAGRDQINAMLSQSTMTSPGFDAAGTTGRGESYMPPQELPVNMIRNNTTGRVFAPTDLQGNPSQSQPAGLAADWSRPVDVMGAKGHWASDNSGRIILRDGRIVEPGRDTGAERARMKEDLGLQKQRAELAQLQANPSSEYDKAMAQERAKRDIFASMPPAMREAEEVKRLGIKLKPGEKYNINKGEIELIPGSVPYNKQAAEVRKESTGLKGLDRVIGNMLDRVSAVEKSPGLSSAVGFWDAATPAIMSGWNAQDKATARAYITNLQEYLQTKGLADLRASGVAPGSITEKEWSKFATMVGNIDPTMDEKSFQKELNNLKTYAANARAEAAAKEATLKKQYGPMWEKYAVSGGEVAPAAPEQGGVVRVKSVNDAMKLKSGTRFIDPNGVERVRP